MSTELSTYRPRFVEYDSLRRRVWILGQRCHHGATGSIVAALACLGLAVQPAHLRAMVTAAAAGSALMAHDWKDHTIWFERGRGTQP
jgi:hypothetical protein